MQVADIQITYTVTVVKQYSFDPKGYEDATDYKDDAYPEITNAYEAVRWERQEFQRSDIDTQASRLLEAIGDADESELQISSYFEVVNDEELDGALQEQVREDNQSLIEDEEADAARLRALRSQEF
jgi:hypothetical protein